MGGLPFVVLSLSQHLVIMKFLKQISWHPAFVIQYVGDVLNEFLVVLVLFPPPTQ